MNVLIDEGIAVSVHMGTRPCDVLTAHHVGNSE